MKSLLKSVSLLGTFLVFNTNFAQVVNAYAKVNSITGLNLTVSNVNQTNHSFVVGEFVVLIQIQDNVIGANTNNDNSFGSLSSISNAGNYEIKEISSINGNSTLSYSTGSITTISLLGISNTYSFNSNSSVQIVSFRNFGTPDFTTTSNMSALPWDGNVGGVLAVWVPGILTLNHSLIADGVGFRGGNVSVNNAGPICNINNPLDFRYNNSNFGFKGEGIYKSVNPLFNNARSKIANGGGGGGHHNAGGAGGGNFTQGGAGGAGYNDCLLNPSGGTGGIALSPFIATGTKVFMGGGGGGGQQNQSVGRDGGNGGGIIFLKAGTITTGACIDIKISANGITPTTNNGVPISDLTATFDAGGGGGAGGNIVFFVDNWIVTSNCPLSINANGGSGSTSRFHEEVAGGGAGAQGAIVFNNGVPASNTIVSTLNGIAGCSDNTVPCDSPAGSANGANNIGIIVLSPNPLPVEVIDFNAIISDDFKGIIYWKTEAEINNDKFLIEKSTDALNWELFLEVNGAGNSFVKNEYKLKDENLELGQNYYRLTQIDFNGVKHEIGVRTIDFQGAKVSIIPFSSSQNYKIVGLNKNHFNIEVLNTLGQTVLECENELIIDFSSLNSGIYYLKIEHNNKVEVLSFYIVN